MKGEDNYYLEGWAVMEKEPRGVLDVGTQVYFGDTVGLVPDHSNKV